MTKISAYRQELNELSDWRRFLTANSGLPGPRGNLELAQAFAELADLAHIERYLKIPEAEAPENTPNLFLVFCAVAALGKLVARGEYRQLNRLRSYASDTRWRVREAVAIGLQYVGDAHMERLLKEMDDWASGNWYEKRAAVAALAEPRLLKEAAAARRVLQIFDRITSDVARVELRRDQSFKVLRQSLGYGWSVAVAALPSEGKTRMSKWFSSADLDIRWIMGENLKKSRLAKLDAKWVRASLEKLEQRR